MRRKASLHLKKRWDRNLTITTRLVDTATIPLLLKTVQSGKLETGPTDHASLSA